MSKEIKWITDVPDNDGYLTYFDMSCRLGLKKGDKIIVQIIKK